MPTGNLFFLLSIIFNTSFPRNSVFIMKLLALKGFWFYDIIPPSVLQAASLFFIPFSFVRFPAKAWQNPLFYRVCDSIFLIASRHVLRPILEILRCIAHCNRVRETGQHLFVIMHRWAIGAAQRAFVQITWSLQIEKIKVESFSCSWYLKVIWFSWKL